MEKRSCCYILFPRLSDGDGYVAARVSNVAFHSSGSTGVASTSPSSGSLINMKEVCETMDKKIEFALAKNNDPACAQCCIFSIVRANFQKYDLYSAPIARALPRYIVPFFKFFRTGKCCKTMLFPVSCVSQKPLPFQKHSLLLIQPKTHAKTLSERSEKCATAQVLTDENSVARATYLQRALGALWRALYQV